MGPRILLNPFGYVRNTVHLGVSPSKRWGHGGIVIEMVFIDVVGPEPPVEAVDVSRQPIICRMNPSMEFSAMSSPSSFTAAITSAGCSNPMLRYGLSSEWLRYGSSPTIASS